MDVLVKVTVLLLILGSCTSTETQNDEVPAERMDIVVTNAPLYYFATRLVPSNAEIHFPMTNASDPAYWDISPDSVSMMQQADLIIMNGADYETWAAKVSLPASRIVYSIDEKANLIPVDNGVTHSHGDEGEHSHQGTAFTTWMDFELGSAQAKNIADALKAEFPQYASAIDEKLSALMNDLNDLHQSMIQQADTSGYYVFSHPVYQYFQRAYRIKGESVHWEPDVQLDADQLHELEHIADHHEIKAVIWEGQPLEGNIQKLDSMGIKSVVIRPAGAWEKDYNFIGIMETNIQNFNQ